MSTEPERDDGLEQVRTTLQPYKAEHPNAQIEVKRQNSVSIRVRVIDPGFQRIPREERDRDIWALLETLPKDIFCDITLLLLLTPEEAETSLANMEFNDPLPSRL